MNFIPSEQKKLYPIRKTRNVGRNDPCPCGSKLKYKKCCLERDNEMGVRYYNRTIYRASWIKNESKNNEKDLKEKENENG